MENLNLELLVITGQFPPRVYVGYSIYKGKAALAVEPRPPEFAPLDVCSLDNLFKTAIWNFIIMIVYFVDGAVWSF